jgi:hypothetical protein
VSGRGRFPEKCHHRKRSTIHAGSRSTAWRWPQREVDERLPDARSWDWTGLEVLQALLGWWDAVAVLGMEILGESKVANAEHWRRQCNSESAQCKIQSSNAQEKQAGAAAARSGRDDTETRATSCTSMLCWDRRCCGWVEGVKTGWVNFFFAVGCCCWQVDGMFAQHTKQAVASLHLCLSASLPLCFSARKATKQRSPSARGRDEDSGWRGLAGKAGGARWRRRPGRRVTGWMGQDGSPAREEGEISISNSKTRFTDSRLMPAGLVLYCTVCIFRLTDVCLELHALLLVRIRPKESEPSSLLPPPSSQRALPLELPTWSYSCPCLPVQLPQWIGRLFLRFVRLHRPFSSQRIIRRDALGPASP